MRICLSTIAELYLFKIVSIKGGVNMEFFFISITFQTEYVSIVWRTRKLTKKWVNVIFITFRGGYFIPKLSTLSQDIFKCMSVRNR